MVLVRSAWNARKLEIKLIEKNVPYIFIGGINLMSSATQNKEQLGDKACKRFTEFIAICYFNTR